MTPTPPVPLRTCRTCGLEAHTEEDLELFVKDKLQPHGRRILCLKCSNEYRRKRSLENDSVYLKLKLNNMIKRCYNSNSTSYKYYGKKGIVVCEEWKTDPDSFVKWALENGWKRELTIDRINNEEGYSPENCRWADRITQNRNKSDGTTNYEKGTRICNVCKQEKPLTDFHFNNKKKNLRRHRCKKCHGEINKVKGSTRTFVSPKEHVKIIEATASRIIRVKFRVSEKKMSMRKMALLLGRSRNTVAEHRRLHDRKVADEGWCSICREGNGKLAYQKVNTLH